MLPVIIQFNVIYCDLAREAAQSKLKLGHDHFRDSLQYRSWAGVSETRQRLGRGSCHDDATTAATVTAK